MHTLTLLLALEASAVAAQKVLPLSLHRNKERVDLPRKLKRATITEPLGNAQSLYYANISVGTPPQPISLQLDTGSSDVWVTAANDKFCEQTEYNCPGGVYDSTQSSTYNLVDQGGFNITYVDGSGSFGDYFTDVFSIGGTTIKSLQMGNALKTTIGTGIIGTSFAADESICEDQIQCQTYPTLLQSLVKAGKINSLAYSLWLDDLEANTGSILFGGVDSDKYTGDLVTLPVQKDADSNAYTSFTVSWTGFSVGTPKGEENNFVPSNFIQPAILDSGTTTLVIPDDLFNQLAAQFGAVPSQELQSYVAPCYLSTSAATFDFQFGGSGGPTIKVPVSEFLLDLGTDDMGNPITFENGDVACDFGIQSNSAGGSSAADGPAAPIIFGDTFLRSAYIVYDLDNKQVSIAQSNFNSDSSNVKEIQSGSQGVPGVSSTASGASISAAVTGPQTQRATLGGNAGGEASASLTAASNGLPPLAQFTTASYTGGGSAVGGVAAGSTSSAAAILAARPPTVEGLGVLVGLTLGMAALGSGLVFL